MELQGATGTAQGYDAADLNGVLGQPSAQEVADSVATTLYTVWRAQFIANTIEATLDGVSLQAGVSLPKPGSDLTLTALKTLLQRPQPGIGASGVNFFNVPGVASAADRRDILVLKSLAGRPGKRHSDSDEVRTVRAQASFGPGRSARPHAKPRKTAHGSIPNQRLNKSSIESRSVSLGGLGTLSSRPRLSTP